MELKTKTLTQVPPLKLRSLHEQEDKRYVATRSGTVFGQRKLPLSPRPAAKEENGAAEEKKKNS